jgi:hypothetical protein
MDSGAYCKPWGVNNLEYMPTLRMVSFVFSLFVGELDLVLCPVFIHVDYLVKKKMKLDQKYRMVRFLRSGIDTGLS